MGFSGINDLPNDECEKEYNLICTIGQSHTGFRDWKKRQLEANIFLLVPDENQDKDAFIKAWVPETDEETNEVIAFIGSPIGIEVRLGVKRRASYCPDRAFLFNMSVDADEAMKRCVGKRVTVKVRPSRLELNDDYSN